MIANHLWQSTLFAALVAVVVRGVGRDHPAARHALWTAASIKFLVPVSWLMSAGAWLSSDVRLAVSPGVVDAVQRIASPFSIIVTGGQTATLPSPNGPTWMQVLLLLWTAGTIACVVWRIAQWRRAGAVAKAGRDVHEGPEVAAVRRTATHMRAASAVRVVLCDDVQEPGVYAVLRPTLIWPSSLSAHLSAEQLTAVVTHEMAHVGRRDNAWALLHTVVEALFWFHPAVWIIGARLLHERERACDVEVLARGTAARTYAESLLVVSRFCLCQPSPGLAGVTSSDLSQRVEAIMSINPNRSLSLSSKTLIAAAALAAVTTPVIAGAIRPDAVSMASAVALTPDAPTNPAVQMTTQAASVAQVPTWTERPAPQAAPVKAPTAKPTPKPASQPQAAPLAASPAAAQTPTPKPAPAPAPIAPEVEPEFLQGAYRLSEAGLVAPKVIRSAEPKYTPEAMRAKIQGVVVMDVVIGADGTVDRARISQSLDELLGLDEQALWAVKRWMFTPGTLNGVAVPVLVTITVTFRVH